MADLFLLPLPHKEKITKARIEKIGQLTDEADAWIKAVVKNHQRIHELATEMQEFGLIKAAKTLLETLE